MEGDGEPPPEARATWYQDVGPILSEHCMSCHQPGGIAPFSLTEYQDAVETSEMMMKKVDAGEMRRSTRARRPVARRATAGRTTRA